MNCHLNLTKLTIILRLSLLICIQNILSGCAAQSESKVFFKGLSYVASPKELPISETDRLYETGANSISIMPFAYMPSAKKPLLIYSMEGQWWGESVKGCRTTIQRAKAKGIQIMLKPQIWCGNGTFTGYIDMATEEEWNFWEENYRLFILKFAELAQEEGVELFCIGTELAIAVEKRKGFWQKLIQDIREKYKGKLTYAENWDSFAAPAFLKDLDYVGVDAYFPLSDQKEPSVGEISKGWQVHLEKLKKCSEATGKQILFTEWGYRNVDFAGSKPWDYSENGAVRNDKNQVNLYKVVFETVFQKDYIAGGFLWKWFPSSMIETHESDTQFTPQGKTAEKLVRKYFQK